MELNGAALNVKPSEKCRARAIPMTWKGFCLGEPQAGPNVAPDVAGKWLFKTKIGIIFKDFENV